MESTLAIAERLASKPEPLCCIWLRRAAISSSFASSAPPCMRCLRCMRLTQCSKPLVLRCRPEQQRIRTEVTDADTTVVVSIGARSGGIRFRSWFSRIWSPPWPPQPQHRMASTAGLGCHCRLACAEAVSAAISSPFASSAPPCMRCMRCMRLTQCSKPLVLRCRWTEVTDAGTTVVVSIGARSGGIRFRSWFSRIWSPPWR